MGKARVKEIKEYIKALEVVGAETILLDAEDLLVVLDRLLKLEKKEAKRKAKKAAAVAEVSEHEALTGALEVGDRVALVRSLETHLWHYVVEGAEGTVQRIDKVGTHAVRVVLDNAAGHPLSFQRGELRKIGKTND